MNIFMYLASFQHCQRLVFSSEDLLLPEEVIKKMIREIPDVRRFDVAGTNHYGIVFQPHKDRDKAIRDFLKES